MRFSALLVLAALAAVPSWAQRGGDPLVACRNRVAAELGVPLNAIDVRRGTDTNNGNMMIDWSLRARRERDASGFCEVNRSNGRVVRFQAARDNRGNRGRDDRGERGRDDRGDRGRYDAGPGNQTPAATNYPRVRADTSGHGSFNARNATSANITRGWIDTTGAQASVALSGSNNFRVTFYGRVIQADDRRIVIEITESDKGRAEGRADIRLNPDKNEVESLGVQGRGFGGDFNGNFSRN
jgi:hypothetical protein